MSHDRTKSLSREYQGSIYFNSYYFVSNFTICNKYDVSHEVDLLNSLLGCLFQNYVMMMIKLSLVGQFSPSFDNDLFLVFSYVLILPESCSFKEGRSMSTWQLFILPFYKFRDIWSFNFKEIVIYLYLNFGWKITNAPSPANVGSYLPNFVCCKNWYLN
jgi:hypothetical protein